MHHNNIADVLSVLRWESHRDRSAREHRLARSWAKVENSLETAILSVAPPLALAPRLLTGNRNRLTHLLKMG